MVGALKDYRNLFPNLRQIGDYCGPTTGVDFEKIRFSKGGKGAKGRVFESTPKGRRELAYFLLRGDHEVYPVCRVWQLGFKVPKYARVIQIGDSLVIQAAHYHVFEVLYYEAQRVHFRDRLESSAPPSAGPSEVPDEGGGDDAGPDPTRHIHEPSVGARTTRRSVKRGASKARSKDRSSSSGSVNPQSQQATSTDKDKDMADDATTAPPEVPKEEPAPPTEPPVELPERRRRQAPPDFDNQFSGAFHAETWAEIEEVRRRNRKNYVNTFHLRKLVAENKVKLVIDEDEPEIGGETLLVTWGGFKLLSGDPLPCRVYRVIVDIDETFSYTCTYCRDKHTGRMVMMVH